MAVNYNTHYCTTLTVLMLTSSSFLKSWILSHRCQHCQWWFAAVDSCSHSKEGSHFRQLWELLSASLSSQDHLNSFFSSLSILFSTFCAVWFHVLFQEPGAPSNCIVLPNGESAPVYIVTKIMNYSLIQALPFCLSIFDVKSFESLSFFKII